VIELARRKSAKKIQGSQSNETEDVTKAKQEDARHATTKRTEHASHGSKFSPEYLKGAIVVLGILVIISAYMLGFQYGKLSTYSSTTTGANTQPAATAAPAQAAAVPSTPPPPTVSKTAKPDVKLFIMSYCPYGLQMQKAWIQAEELLGSKANMQVHWVNYAMHGYKEVQDNVHEYCIQKEQPDKFVAYEKCFVEKTDYAACAAATGVDTAKVDSCYAATDAKFGIQAAYDDKASWLSGRYPKFPIDDALNQQYGVRGSPTLVINGKQVQVARSAEAVKQAVCAAFTTPPKECQTTLNTKQEQPGPGSIGAGTIASAGPAAAGCGA